MKKNKIISASMIALLSVSTLGAGVTAFADEEAAVVVNGRTSDAQGETTATITFDNTGSITKPIQPVNPEEQMKVNPTGDLAFIYVTKNIDFGTYRAGVQADFPGQKGNTAYEDFQKPAGDWIAKPVENKKENQFQMEVLDSRTGVDQNGWYVSGKLSSEFKAVGSETVEPITGITLSFPETADSDIFTNQVNENNEANKDHLSAPGVTLDGNESTTSVIFLAKENGFGLHAFQDSVNDIKLHVPMDKQAKGTLTNTILWTLAAGPVESSSTH